MYSVSIIFADTFKEDKHMKKGKFGIIIGIISFVAAVSAALTAFFIVREKKKKDDEELMEYLDCSIE